MQRQRARTLIVIAAVAATRLLMAGWPAVAQGLDVDQNGQRTDLPQIRQQLNVPLQVRQHIDASEMSKTSPVLSQIVQGVPIFIAAVCALALLGRVVGIYQMGTTGILFLLAVMIGGVVYRLHGHS